MLTALSSVRTTVRALRRAPGFSLISILTLAVGIGATAAIFTVVNAVLLQPLPYHEPQQIMGVSNTAPGLGMDVLEQSDGTFFVYRRDSRSFTDLGIYSDGAAYGGAATLTGGQEPERISASRATAGVFAVLRQPAALGRTLQEEDEKPGAPPVAVLSHGLWHRRFGGDPQVIGTMLKVDGVATRIVGVMPPGFHFPSAEVELWVPLTIDPVNLRAGNFNSYGIGRLRPGVLPETAAHELSELALRVTELPNTLIDPKMLRAARFGALVHPLRDDIVGNVARVLWLVLGSVGIILLIACANVANLFLVRAEGRQREMAVRSALGASRWSITRIFLEESAALSLIGGAIGLALAAAGTRVLVAMRPENLPRLEEIAVNGTVLAFTVAVSLLSGLLVGLFAALRYGRPDLVPALQEGGRGGTVGRERLFARNALVVVQMALSLVLLVGAGLMVKSFWRLRNVSPGFDPKNVLTVRLNLPESEYATPQAPARFVVQLLEKVQALPGVESVAVNTVLPLSDGGDINGHVIEGRPIPQGGLPEILATRRVSPSYFETMRIPLLQGQLFDRIDPDKVTTQAIVSQSLAAKYWPGQNPLGKRLAQGIGDTHAEWSTIVGVVGSIRENGLGEAPVETVYYPYQPQEDFKGTVSISRNFTLVVRSTKEPQMLTRPVRDAVWSLDPNLPLSQVRTMDEVAERSMVQTTFTMFLLVVAALIALVLGSVGIYAVISYVVSQRTREIGVRMALGAGRRDISRMVLKEGLGLVLLGILLGLTGAFALTRLMLALLFGVSPTDPATFAAVPALLAVIALFASWLPARRAASVQPLEAIRGE